MLPIGVEIEEESPYPTLEEAANMAAQSSYANSTPKTTNNDWGSNDAIPSTSTSHSNETAEASSSSLVKEIKEYIGHSIPKDFLLKSGLLNPTSNGENDSAQPLYKVNSDGSVKGISQFAQLC